MGSAPSPPTPPDPNVVAQAQQKSNVATANAQARLNATNQVTPFGSLNYTAGPTDANGTPQYTATQTLNPQLQGLLDTSTGTANTLLKNAQNAYQNPPNIDPSGAINKAMGMQQQYLQPFFDQQERNLRAQLQNQGLAPGDQAYDMAVKQMQENQTQAMDSALAQFEPMAFNQAIQSYELPAQMVGILEGLQPGQQPINPPQTGVSPTDVVGAYQNYQNAQQQAYQARMQNYSSMMGGLFSIPSALAGGWAFGGFKGLGG